MSTQKALKAKKSALRCSLGTKQHKSRKSTTFHLPKTLILQRNPKYERISKQNIIKMDEYKVIKFPLTTESAMKKIEDDNTLVFICDVKVFLLIKRPIKIK